MSLRNCLISLLLLILLAGSALADAWFRGSYSGYSIVSTYYTDSRYQTVILKEELSGAFGEWDGITLNVWQATGYDYTNVTVRGRRAVSADITALAGGSFLNTDLITLFTGDIEMTAVDEDTWEVAIPFNQGTASMSDYYGIGYLLDICVNNDAVGPGHTYLCSTTAGDVPALRAQGQSTSSTYNLLDATVGSACSYRPLIKLHGIYFEADGVLYPGQLAENITSDILVPVGQSLQIFPGTTLDFSYDVGLVVEGSLEAVGLEGDEILFTGSYWDGIYFKAEDTEAASLIEHAIIRNVNSELHNGLGAVGCKFHDAGLTLRNLEIYDCITARGGGVYTSGSDILMEDLYIHDCESETAGGIHIWGGGSICRNSRIENCYGYTGGIYLEASHSTMEGLSLLYNSGVIPNLRVTSGYGDFIHNCTFIDNYAYNYAAYVYNYSPAATLFKNCLFITPNDEAIYTGHGRTLVSHCATFDGMSNYTTSSSGAYVVNLGGNVSFSSLFDEVNMCAYVVEASIVDAGSEGEFDPDLTRKDIGSGYFDQSAPIVSQLSDIPADQGHQLQLEWQASSMDLAELHANWFYSVWRLDSLFASRNADESVWLEDVSQLDPAQIGDTPIRVTTPEGFVWTFVSQVPATQAAEYGLVVPTLHDRLNGEDWPSTLMVYWHHDTELAESETATAVSVDNIAPDAPLALTATTIREEMLLSWDEVTTGTLNGVTLPERNGIVYHIYASEEAWFEIEDADYLGSVNEPQIVLPVTDDSRRFFKIVASDSQ